MKTFSSNNCSGTALGTKNLSFSVLPITANPTLAQSCGIDVVLVLDETGSIQSAGATQNVRDAAIAFANGIADTGSKLALVEFNTTGSVTIPLTSVTSSWVSGAFTTHLNTNYNPTDRTNWEAGLLAAQTVASAKLVVFITDGNPNEPGAGSGPDGDVLVMQKAFDAAGAIKAAGKHIFAVGVGNALSQPSAQIRLKAVSGNNVWTSGSLNDKDVTFVTSFTDLQAALRSAAEALCGRELKVTKQVDENGDGVFNDSSTTPFTVKATVTVTGGSANPVKWIDPNDAAAASPKHEVEDARWPGNGIVPLGSESRDRSDVRLCSRGSGPDRVRASQLQLSHRAEPCSCRRGSNGDLHDQEPPQGRQCHPEQAVDRCPRERESSCRWPGQGNGERRERVHRSGLRPDRRRIGERRARRGVRRWRGCGAVHDDDDVHGHNPDVPELPARHAREPDRRRQRHHRVHDHEYVEGCSAVEGGEGVCWWEGCGD